MLVTLEFFQSNRRSGTLKTRDCKTSCICSDKLQDLNNVLMYCATVCFVCLLYVLSAVIDN